MNELRHLNRIAFSYERLIQKSSYIIKKNCDFHIEQLENAIELAKILEGPSGDDIQNWAEALQEVYEVKEVDFFFQRITLWFMKKLTTYKYVKAIKYSYNLAIITDRLYACLSRLNQIKFFSS